MKILLSLISILSASSLTQASGLVNCKSVILQGGQPVLKAEIKVERARISEIPGQFPIVLSGMAEYMGEKKPLPPTQGLRTVHRKGTPEFNAQVARLQKIMNVVPLLPKSYGVIIYKATTSGEEPTVSVVELADADMVSLARGAEWGWGLPFSVCR